MFHWWRSDILNEFWGHDSHLLASDVTFHILLGLSLIAIKQNDMKLRMQELSAPLAVCHDSCYHWSWCNTLQSEVVQQIITAAGYSRVQSHDSRPAGFCPCEFHSSPSAVTSTDWSSSLTLKAFNTTGTLVSDNLSLPNQLATVKVEWMLVIVRGVNHTLGQHQEWLDGVLTDSGAVRHFGQGNENIRWVWSQRVNHL